MIPCRISLDFNNDIRKYHNYLIHLMNTTDEKKFLNGQHVHLQINFNIQPVQQHGIIEMFNRIVQVFILMKMINQ